MGTISCVRCGATVYTRTHNRKYCDACKRLAKNEWQLQYAAKHREQERERARRWAAAHPDRHRQRVTAWTRANTARVKNLRRQYYLEHKDSIMTRVKEYAAKHPEAARERRRRWKRRHPEVVRQHARRRRVRRLQSPGMHTYGEFLRLCRRYDWRCAYCGMQLTEETATEDHLVPLSRGGSDSIGNIVPACMQCNAAKGAMTRVEFLAYREGGFRSCLTGNFPAG